MNNLIRSGGDRANRGRWRLEKFLFEQEKSARGDRGAWQWHQVRSPIAIPGETPPIRIEEGGTLVDRTDDESSIL